MVRISIAIYRESALRLGSVLRYIENLLYGQDQYCDI